MTLVSLYFLNVATRKFKIAYVAHVTCLLDDAGLDPTAFAEFTDVRYRCIARHVSSHTERTEIMCHGIFFSFKPLPKSP